MLQSQKLSRIGFKMIDLEEYEQLKRNKSAKSMDSTPDLKSEGATSNALLKTPRKTLGNVPSSNRSTPGQTVSFRSSTPERS